MFDVIGEFSHMSSLQGSNKLSIIPSPGLILVAWKWGLAKPCHTLLGPKSAFCMAKMFGPNGFGQLISKISWTQHLSVWGSSTRNSTWGHSCHMTTRNSKTQISRATQPKAKHMACARCAWAGSPSVAPGLNNPNGSPADHGPRKTSENVQSPMGSAQKNWQKFPIRN